METRQQPMVQKASLCSPLEDKKEPIRIKKEPISDDSDEQEIPEESKSSLSVFMQNGNNTVSTLSEIKSERSSQGKDILEEEDAAAVAACLDLGSFVPSDSKNHEPTSSISIKVFQEKKIKTEKMDLDCIRTSKVHIKDEEHATSLANIPHSSTATDNDKSVKCGRRGSRRKVHKADVEDDDPTYVMESSDSSEEEQPIKRRLRKAPKRRKLGRLDTFTEHLEVSKRPRKVVRSQHANSEKGISVETNLVMHEEDPAYAKMSHDQRMQAKEQNIKRLKDLIRQQEEAIEKIRKEKDSLERSQTQAKGQQGLIQIPMQPPLIHIPLQPHNVTQQVSRKTPKVQPVVLTSPSTVIPQGLQLPLARNLSTSGGVSLQIPPGFKSTSISNSPTAKLVIGSDKIQPTRTVVPKPAMLTSVNSTSLMQGPFSSAHVLTSPGIPITASTTSLKSPQAPATNVNLGMLRIPTVGSPTNGPGVLLKVPIPNSTGHQLLFVPRASVTANTGLGGTTQQTIATTPTQPIVPTFRPLQKPGDANQKMMLMPIQQPQNGYRLPRPILIKPSSVVTTHNPSVLTSATSLTSSNIPLCLTAIPSSMPTILTDTKPNLKVLTVPNTVPSIQITKIVNDLQLKNAGKPSVDTTGGKTNSALKQNSCDKDAVSAESDTQFGLGSTGPMNASTSDASTVNDSATVSKTQQSDRIQQVNEGGNLVMYKNKIKEEAEDHLSITTLQLPSQPAMNDKDDDRETESSLQHARQALKHVLINKDKTNELDADGQSSSLSVLKRALKDVFSSDVWKTRTSVSSEPITTVKSSVESKMMKTEATECVSQDAGLSTATTATSSGTKLNFKTSASVTQSNSVPFVENIMSPISTTSTLSVSTGQGYSRPNILLRSNYQNAKAKVLMPQNGQYISTSLPALGLVNAVSSQNVKPSSPLLPGKKPQQQLSGILVRLKDGGVKFVKIPEPAKTRGITNDELRASLALIRKPVSADSSKTSVEPTAGKKCDATLGLYSSVSRCLPKNGGISPTGTNPQVQTQVGVAPILALLAPNQAISPQIVQSNGPTIVPRISTAIPISVESNVFRTKDSVMSSLHVPNTNRNAVLNYANLDSTRTCSEKSKISSAVQPVRTIHGLQKVGLALGAQERMIALDSERKRDEHFVPCPDNSEFCRLTGLEFVVDAIQHREQP